MTQKIVSFVFVSFFIFTLIHQGRSSNPQNKFLKINRSDNHEIVLEFDLGEFLTKKRIIDNVEVTDIIWGESFLPAEENFPNLPSISKFILVPDDANVELSFSTINSTSLNNILVSPSAKVQSGRETKVTQPKLGEQYSKNEYYPLQPVSIKTTEVRGFKLVQLRIIPFQANSVTEELLVHQKLKITIHTNSKTNAYGQQRFRSIYWDQIFQDVIFNFDDIPDVNYSKDNRVAKESGSDYVILTPDIQEYLQWADSIKIFREKQGISTRIITTSDIGGNIQANIETFFHEIYNTWDPVPSAVLFLGDYGDDENQIMSKFLTDHENEGAYVSDSYFSDVTNNNLPDFVMGRIPAKNEDELQTMVAKVLEYEKNPPEIESFYSDPLVISAYQSNLWFQMTSQSLIGYMTQNLGKSPRRLDEIVSWVENNPETDPWSIAPNALQPINYFGLNGLNYIPEKPADVGPWGGDTADDIIDHINSGAFMVFYRGHGMYDLFIPPEFTIPDVYRLNNSFPTHIFLIGCSNGAFNYSNPCILESFMSYKKANVLSGTAATALSWSFYNDCISWGMIDNMWPDFLPDYGNNEIEYRGFRPAFGLASSKYYMMNSNWIEDDYKKTITSRIWQHFGDPFATIYTEKPKNILAEHEFSISSLTNSLTINTEPNALIGLSKDGALLASVVSDASGFAILNFEEQNAENFLDLVITKQNYYRYEEQIFVHSEQGSYLKFGEIVFSDQNNNSLIENGENISASFTLRNYGIEDANDIIITFNENDQFIDILSGHQINIENIAVDGEVYLDQAIELISDFNTPDQYLAEIKYTIADNYNEIGGVITILINSPKIDFLPMEFIEKEGNMNNIPEPGEVVDVSVGLINNGHAGFSESLLKISSNESLISLEYSQQVLNRIGAKDTVYFVYTMSISDTIINFTSYSHNFKISTLPTVINKTLFFNVGIVAEDFETADFEKYYWTFSGDKEWEIKTDYFFEGEFSAGISDLQDNERASLTLEHVSFDDNYISFRIQISTEKESDYLNFSIDDSIVGQWSGLVLFDFDEPYRFLIPKGYHKLKWEYVKDENFSSGLDAAWIDYIILPPGEIPTGTQSVLSKNQLDYIVYPNPSSNGNIYLYNQSNHQIDNVEVFNVNGNRMMEYSNSIGVNQRSLIKLNTNSIGIYYLKIWSNNQSKTKKIILY
jgi:hypothetical protein